MNYALIFKKKNTPNKEFKRVKKKTREFDTHVTVSYFGNCPPG